MSHDHGSDYCGEQLGLLMLTETWGVFPGTAISGDCPGTASTLNCIVPAVFWAGSNDKEYGCPASLGSRTPQEWLDGCVIIGGPLGLR